MQSRKATTKCLRHRGIKIKKLPNPRRLGRRKERLDFDIHPNLFGLWAKEVVLDYTPNGITKKAIEALQVSTERFISLLFKDAKLCAYHRDSPSVDLRDFQLAAVLTNTKLHFNNPGDEIYTHHKYCNCKLPLIPEQPTSEKNIEVTESFKRDGFYATVNKYAGLLTNREFSSIYSKS